MGLERSLKPELIAGGRAAEEGRPIRIGGDVLLVKALTGLDGGIAVLETVAPAGAPAPLDHIHRSYDEAF